MLTAIGLYIATPMLRKIVDDKKTCEYFLIVSFTFTFLIRIIDILLMIKGYMYAHDYFNSFALTSISPLIGYFVLGYYIDNYGLKNEKYFIFLGILGLLITVFGTSFLSRNIGYATETFYASGTPNVYFTSVAVFVFAKEKLNKPKNAKLLLQLSKYTLCIYPIHPLIQSILNKNGITNMFFNPVYGVLFYFSLSYIC